MLSDAIKKNRKEAGITQEALSKATKIPRERIIAIERGTGRISLNEFEAVLRIIECKAVIIPNKILNS